MLAQIDHDGREHPIAYGSRLLRGGELKYAPTQGECFSVVHWLQHFRHYLYGVRFILEVDHWALKWLMTTAQSGMLARWAMRLQEFDMEIKHRPGHKHVNADAMSRPPVAPAPKRATMIAFTQSVQEQAAGEASPRSLRIGYGSGVEEEEEEVTQPYSTEDAGPPVSPSLACEVCHQPDQDDLMLICSGCNKGYHTFCLQPPMTDLPPAQEPWYCEKCSDTQDSLDITDDKNTLDFLQGVPVVATAREKARIRARAQRYHLVAGRLHHKQSNRPVPTIAERPGIIQDIHEVGHFGVARTAWMVQRGFWWYGLRDEVKAHVKECRACQMMHTKFNEPVELHPIAVQGVYHQVGVDVVGPFPPSLSGKVYIATSMDYMTKNAEARALPNKTADELADFFYEDVICRHGTPAKCTTDHGGEFDGAFQALLDRCHIDHRLSSPYHPQANGLTERFNQTLGRALKKMVGQYPEHWDKHIPTILMGYRASIQASTHYSPFFLLHGREMVLPVHNLHRLPAPEADTIDPTAEALLNNVQPLQDALAAAQENIQRAQDKQRRLYAQRQLHGSDKGKAPIVPTETRSTVPLEAMPSRVPAAATVAQQTSTPAQNSSGPSLTTAQNGKEATNANGIAATAADPAAKSTLPAGSKRGTPEATRVRVGDFVLVKIHAKGRGTVRALGKLAPTTEGPYILAGFTDDTQEMAIIEDAEGKTWKRKTADLSVYNGDA